VLFTERCLAQWRREPENWPLGRVALHCTPTGSLDGLALPAAVDNPLALRSALLTERLMAVLYARPVGDQIALPS
jgi:hypothetical protein